MDIFEKHITHNEQKISITNSLSNQNCQKYNFLTQATNRWADRRKKKNWLIKIRFESQKHLKLVFAP